MIMSNITKKPRKRRKSHFDQSNTALTTKILLSLLIHVSNHASVSASPNPGPNPNPKPRQMETNEAIDPGRLFYFTRSNSNTVTNDKNDFTDISSNKCTKNVKLNKNFNLFDDSEVDTSAASEVNKICFQSKSSKNWALKFQNTELNSNNIDIYFNLLHLDITNENVINANLNLENIKDYEILSESLSNSKNADSDQLSSIAETVRQYGESAEWNSLGELDWANLITIRMKHKQKSKKFKGQIVLATEAGNNEDLFIITNLRENTYFDNSLLDNSIEIRKDGEKICQKSLFTQLDMKSDFLSVYRLKYKEAIKCDAESITVITEECTDNLNDIYGTTNEKEITDFYFNTGNLLNVPEGRLSCSGGLGQEPNDDYVNFYCDLESNNWSEPTHFCNGNILEEIKSNADPIVVGGYIPYDSSSDNRIFNNDDDFEVKDHSEAICSSQSFNKDIYLFGDSHTFSSVCFDYRWGLTFSSPVNNDVKLQLNILSLEDDNENYSTEHNRMQYFQVYGENAGSENLAAIGATMNEVAGTTLVSDITEGDSSLSWAYVITVRAKRKKSQKKKLKMQIILGIDDNEPENLLIFTNILENTYFDEDGDLVSNFKVINTNTIDVDTYTKCQTDLTSNFNTDTNTRSVLSINTQESIKCDVIENYCSNNIKNVENLNDIYGSGLVKFYFNSDDDDSKGRLICDESNEEVFMELWCEEDENRWSLPTHECFDTLMVELSDEVSNESSARTPTPTITETQASTETPSFYSPQMVNMNYDLTNDRIYDTEEHYINPYQTCKDIDLGFNFEIFEETFTKVCVTSRGSLRFDNPSNHDEYIEFKLFYVEDEHLTLQPSELEIYAKSIILNDEPELLEEINTSLKLLGHNGNVNNKFNAIFGMNFRRLYEVDGQNFETSFQVILGSNRIDESYIIVSGESLDNPDPTVTLMHAVDSTDKIWCPNNNLLEEGSDTSSNFLIRFSTSKQTLNCYCENYSNLPNEDARSNSYLSFAWKSFNDFNTDQHCFTDEDQIHVPSSQLKEKLGGFVFKSNPKNTLFKGVEEYTRVPTGNVTIDCHLHILYDPVPVFGDKMFTKVYACPRGRVRFVYEEDPDGLGLYGDEEKSFIEFYGMYEGDGEILSELRVKIMKILSLSGIMGFILIVEKFF